MDFFMSHVIQRVSNRSDSYFEELIEINSSVQLSRHTTLEYESTISTVNIYPRQKKIGC